MNTVHQIYHKDKEIKDRGDTELNMRLFDIFSTSAATFTSCKQRLIHNCAFKKRHVKLMGDFISHCQCSGVIPKNGMSDKNSKN